MKNMCTCTRKKSPEFLRRCFQLNGVISATLAERQLTLAEVAFTAIELTRSPNMVTALQGDLKKEEEQIFKAQKKKVESSRLSFFCFFKLFFFFWMCWMCWMDLQVL